MNYSLLDKLTIIIYTYNRHKYLVRLINYWSNYNVKLLILDGSRVRLDDSFLQSKNIKYVYDTRGLSERILSSLNYIDTEFIILGCDDEFYLPSALSSSIEFLSKEKDFSSCGGCAIGFITRGKNIFGIEVYPKLKNFSLDQNSAWDRILKHFSNYVPAHIYSVMRFNKWKIICKCVFEKKISFVAAPEIFIEFLMVIAGKSKIIPQLLWFRNKEVPTIDSNDLNKNVEIKNWWFESNYQNEKLDFLKKLKNACDELLIDQNLSLNEKKYITTYPFEVYININFLKNNLLTKIKIRNLIPYNIKKILLYFLSGYVWIKNFFLGWYLLKICKHKSLLFEINRLEKQGISINHKELNLIISSIRDFKIKN